MKEEYSLGPTKDTLSPASGAVGRNALSEDKYRHLFNSLDNGFCIIEVLYDENGKPNDYIFLEANPALIRQTGLTDVIGKKVSQLVPTLDRHWFERYGSIVATGQPARFQDAAVAMGYYYDVYAFPVGLPEERRVAVMFNDILEQKKAEEALRLSEEKYRVLFNSMHSGFCVIKVLVDEHGKAYDYHFLDANPAYSKITGWNNVIGKTLKEIAPEYISNTFDLYSNVISTGQPAYFQNDVSAAGHFYDGYAFRIGNAEEQTVAVIFNDIIEQKRAEEALRNSEQQLRATQHRLENLLKASMAGTFSLHIPTNVVKIDATLSEYFNAPLEATTTGIDLALVLPAVHPDDIEYVGLAITEALESKGIYDMQYRVIGKNNTMRWLSARGTVETDSEGQPLYLSGFCIDITHIKEAEKSLHRSEEEYRTLFNSIDEGFCTIKVLFDENGKAYDYIFLEANPAFEKLTGLVNAVGKTMRQIVPDHEEIWFENYGKVAATGNPIRFEQSSHALESYFDLYAFRIGDPSEHKVAVLFNNISERKLAEEALRKQTERELELRDIQLSINQEQMRRKDEFIGIASHELKTPVTSIKVYTEILQERFETAGNSQDAALMEKLNTQVDRLTNLINDLLDTTKIAEGKLPLLNEKFAINTLITELVEELQRISPKHTIVFEAGESKDITADRERIGQVLTNLISNAIKYSPDGGEVYVKTEALPTGVKISITDHGIGIPDDLKSKVFDRFFRVDNPKMQTYPGMGLGLFITAGIVQRHGGIINFESEEGKGSTFYVTLPYVNSENVN